MDKQMDLLHRIITEEVSKNEINDIVKTSNEKLLKSKEFEKQVKVISAKVIEELYKLLWQRKGFWADSINK